MQLNLNKLLRMLVKAAPVLQGTIPWLNGFVYAASILMISALIYEHGFRVSTGIRVWIEGMYRCIWILFLTDTTVQLLFRYTNTRRNFRLSAWVLSGALYLTLIPVIFDRPDSSHQWIRAIWDFLGSKGYHVGVLLILSVFQLSNLFVRFLGRRTNPSLILASGFLFLIVAGTGLLKLPRCTVDGISLVDSLFMATSAVCVTGLSPVEISEVFTVSGQILLIGLVQIGGVGVMTMTSFFALFFMGNISLYNQLVIKDMVRSDSLSSLFSVMGYILAFTVVIEGAGMIALFLSIRGLTGMQWDQELAFAAFHSISAFCNAGFSTVEQGMGNELFAGGRNSLLLSISLLVILGGIGFPILVNLRLSLIYYAGRFGDWIRQKKKRRIQYHIYNLNTKIVLCTTLILLVTGTLVMAFFEWNHAFAGMNVSTKLTESFFHAVSPRTSGFATVPLQGMAIQSLLVYTFLMWIGGGAQSTAGGIKVNTFAVLILNIMTTIRGGDKVEIFGRQLSQSSVRRANATAIVSGIVLFMGVFVLSVTEEGVPVFSLIFESVSAMSTAGATLGVTHRLSSEGKLVFVLLMFVGRVGLITFMMGMIRQKPHKRYQYPMDEITIN